jgi:hypothetical protein
VDQLVFGIAIGVLVAIAGAIANGLVAFSLERQRWKREDQVQERRWEREDQVRYHQERFQVYKEFSAEVDRLLHSTTDYSKTRDRLGELFADIELLGYSPVRQAALSVLIAADVYWQEADAPPAKSRVDEASLALTKRLKTFNDAARKELGVIGN